MVSVVEEEGEEEEAGDYAVGCAPFPLLHRTERLEALYGIDVGEESREYPETDPEKGHEHVQD